jgi:hypothetical protein
MNEILGRVKNQQRIIKNSREEYCYLVKHIQK